MERAIEGKALRKSYKDREAVCGVDLEIEKGECFGLLGPNGAGKSSLLKMLYGATKITSGELYILGTNVNESYQALKKRVGVVAQDDGLDPDFNVLDNLIIFASYFGIDKKTATSRAHELLKFMKIEEYSNEAVDNLSGGMRRRLAIARGLLNNPDILILDEPTTGLDPQVRIWIWDRLRLLKESERTLVVSTHYMEEAERICDRVAIMDQGVILDIGEPKALIAKHIGETSIDFEVRDEDRVYYLGRLQERGFDFLETSSEITVYTQNRVSAEDIGALLGAKKLSLRPSTLDDVFLKLTGHPLESETYGG